MSVDINNVISELSKIDTSKYQNIIIDENKKITVLEPQDGEASYASGARTDTRELFDALTVAKIASRALKTNESENPHEQQRNLEALKKIRFELKKSLTEQVPALTPEALKEMFPPKNFPEPDGAGEELTDRDRVVQNFYLKRSGYHKKMREAYRAIEMETRNPKPSASKKENFIVLGNEFQAYRLDLSQKFIIHATNLSNFFPLVDQIQNQASSKPNMCVSLINHHSNFYASSLANRVALVLAVDPRQLVLTSAEDIWSPTVASYGKEKVRRFYNTQERLIPVTDRINQIHQLSGLEDSYLRYQMLARFIPDVFGKYQRELRFYEKFFGPKKEDYSAYIKLNPELKGECEEEVKSAKTRVDEIFRLIGIDVRKGEKLLCYMKRHQQNNSIIQIFQLINYYEANPEKNNSPEGFMKIFQYPGLGIVEELRKYKKILKRLQTLDSYPHLRSLHKPEELVGLTQPSQYGDHARHNEINVKLDTQGTRPTQVKGLVLTRHMLEACTIPSPKNKAALEKAEQFSQLIQFAKENNLPIYILENNRLPSAKL